MSPSAIAPLSGTVRIQVNEPDRVPFEVIIPAVNADFSDTPRAQAVLAEFNTWVSTEANPKVGALMRQLARIDASLPPRYGQVYDIKVEEFCGYQTFPIPVITSLSQTEFEPGNTYN